MKGFQKCVFWKASALLALVSRVGLCISPVKVASPQGKNPSNEMLASHMNSLEGDVSEGRL